MTPVVPSGQLIDPDPETDLFGKTVDELQTGVNVSGTKITGTLHYVTGYTGFSSIPGEQSGHYLVTHYQPTPANADVMVYKTSGTVGWKTLDKPDLTLVSHITDKSTQKLQVKYKLGDVESDVIEYDLSGLTLEEQELDLES